MLAAHARGERFERCGGPVRVRHAKRRGVDCLHRQAFGRERFHQLHRVYGGGHIAVALVQAQIAARRAVQPQGVAQPDFFFGAARRKHMRRPVVAQDGRQLDRHAQLGQPRGDVVPYAARAHGDRADVAVARDELAVGHAANVKV